MKSTHDKLTEDTARIVVIGATVTILAILALAVFATAVALLRWAF